MDPWSTSRSSFRGHRNSKAGTCHFIQHHASPPAKRVHYSSSSGTYIHNISLGSLFSHYNLEYHVPSLNENKTLVSAFKGLKAEMAHMREQMQNILSQDTNNLSFYSSSSYFPPSSSFSSSLVSPSSSPSSIRRSSSPMHMWERSNSISIY